MKWLTLIRRRDWRWLLSHLVPMPMSTTYRVTTSTGPERREHASWVQRRGRVLRHRISPLP